MWRARARFARHMRSKIKVGESFVKEIRACEVCICLGAIPQRKKK